MLHVIGGNSYRLRKGLLVAGFVYPLHRIYPLEIIYGRKSD